MSQLHAAGRKSHICEHRLTLFIAPYRTFPNPFDNIIHTIYFTTKWSLWKGLTLTEKKLRIKNPLNLHLQKATTFGKPTGIQDGRAYGVLMSVNCPKS